MKVRAYTLLCLVLGVTFSSVSAYDTRAATSPALSSSIVGFAAQGRNTINVMIFNDAGRPAGDVFLELQDELGRAIRSGRASGSGRFEFAGLGEGRYKVRVMPYGTDYAEQIQDVQITNVSAIGGGTGGEVKYVEFYLRLRPEITAGPFAAPGIVFAQEVPDAAKKLYERGIGELRAKKEKEGFESLREAIAVFPDYYMALDRLGTEYAARGRADRAYLEAAQVLLTKAIKLNPKSFSSTFGLGFAQYHLGMIDQAVENMQRAVNLYDKSVNGFLWLGIAQKKAGKLALAEASLVRANKIGGGKVADVHWQLAGVYNEQKRYREAADSLELFLKNQPDSRDSEKIKQLVAQLRQKAAAK